MKRFQVLNLNPTVFIALLFALNSSAVIASTQKNSASANKNNYAGMTTLFENGLSLSGSQYWVFIGSVPFHYPDDVSWGFYPGNVSEQTIACAEKSFFALRSLMRSDWALMQKAVAKGATNDLSFLVTDYSIAADSRRRRTSHLWHSADSSGEYAAGQWIWEVSLSDGVCYMPNMTQINSLLKHAIKTLSKKPE